MMTPNQKALVDVYLQRARDLIASFNESHNITTTETTTTTTGESNG
jgi:hypothetical protein